MIEPELISQRALDIFKWMLELWRSGRHVGPAIDLDLNESELYETHPDVIALRELSSLGLVVLTEDEFLKMSWTLGADLTELGKSLSDDPRFN
jgi:hypothetical protein